MIDGHLLHDESGHSWLVGEAEYHDNGEVHILPLRERTPKELEAMAKQTEEHKKYRQELYKRYSLADRIKDLKR